MSAPNPFVDEQQPEAGSGSRRMKGLKRAGFVIGLLLLGSAIVVVWQHREAVESAWEALRSPSPGKVAALLACVLANLFLTSLLFSHLISRYEGHVGLLEMQAVMSAACLLNYLPARPGLFGRVAYHKAVNQVRARDSAKTIVQASMLSAVVSGYLILAAIVAIRLGVSMWAELCAPFVVLGVGLIWRRWRFWSVAALIRYVETLVWGARYALVFNLVGSSAGIEASMALAGVSIVATMVPLVSNGLGLREWTTGLLAPVFTRYPLQVGVTADLVNRAAEIVVFAIAGLIGLSWLAHRRHHYRDRSRAKTERGAPTDRGDAGVEEERELISPQ